MSPLSVIITITFILSTLISPQDAAEQQVQTGSPSINSGHQATEPGDVAAEVLSNKLALLLLHLHSQQQANQSVISPTSPPPATAIHPATMQIQEPSRGPRVRVQPSASGNVSTSTVPVPVRQRWRQIESTVGESLGELASKLNESLVGLNSQGAAISRGCRAAIDELVEALAKQQLWATKMLDASAHRLPSGFLEGTMTELGNFDQCLGISYQSHVVDAPAAGRMQVSSSTGRGQYCSILVKPPLTPRQRLHTVCQKTSPLAYAFESDDLAGGDTRMFKLLAQNNQHFYYAGIRLGICVPNKCQKSDIQSLVNYHLAKYQLNGQVKSCQVQSNDSEILDLSRFDSVQKSIIFVMAAWLLISLLGTAIDMATERRRRKLDSLMGGSGKLVASCKSSLLGQQFMPRSLASDCENLDLCSGDGSSQSAWTNQRLPFMEGTGEGCWHPASMGQGCQVHARPPSEPQPPGVQRNPLASGIDGQFSRLSHSLADEPLDKLEGAAWLLALERERANGRAHPQRKFRARKSLPRLLEPERISRSATGSSLADLLVCFSIRNNLRLLTRHSSSSTSAIHSGGELSSSAGRQEGDESSSEIKVVHGLRVIAMIWIIFGHTIGLVNPEMMNNLFSVAHLSCSSRILQALLNATLAVNTFFMISGLVTAVSLLRRCQSGHLLLVSQLKCWRRPAGALVRHKNLQQRYRQPARCGHRQADPSPSPSAGSLLDSLSALSTSEGSAHACLRRPASLLSPEMQALAGAHKLARHKRHAEPLHHSTSLWPSDFRPILWLVMRYLRLTPAYGATIMLALLMPALGSGPFWPESAGQMGASCRSLWWTNLLYANNFVQTDRLCLIHSWYLSNDCQFFLVALLLLAVSYRSKGFALVLFVALFAGSSAATFALTVSNEFPPTIVTTSPAVAERWQFIHQLYYKPWPHLPSYLIGLVVGYLVVLRERLELGKWGRRCGWLASSFLALAVLNSVYPWNMGLQVEPLITGLHSSTFRSLWACCCGWLVWALASQPQSQLAKLFSWHGFRLLSRLTYCAYLIHPLVIYYHFGTLRERMDSSIYSQSHRFMGTLLLSYLGALVLSLLVETPSMQLLRLMSRWAASSSNPNDPDYQRNRKSSASSAQSASTISWSQTSSFSDQQNLVKGLDTEQAKSRRLAMDQTPPMARAADQVPTRPLVRDPGARYQADWSTAKMPEDVVATAAAATKAMDTEFQHKLAQAIGRGFRIRSRMAAGSSQASLSQTDQVTSGGPAVVPPPMLPPESRKVELSSFIASSSSSGLHEQPGHAHQVHRRRESLAQMRSRSQDLQPGASMHPY